MHEGSGFLIKQCPCFRENEGEHLCVNDNYMKKMLTIHVGTELFGSAHLSNEFIKSKASEDNLCFCLAYLGDDEFYYCMSQQQNIKIRGQQVSREEMKRALEILALKNTKFSSILCGECLYKIISALKEDRNTSCPI